MTESISKKLIIAIDGYSSCGKSTLAKALAKELDYLYIDSGAMYRAVTFYFINENIGLSELQNMKKERLQELLKHILIEFKVNPQTSHSEIFLNGENVEKEIRRMDVSKLVSPVSAIAAIRNRMVEKQRAYGKDRG